MPHDELPHAWRKSRRSDQQGACVEVADLGAQIMFRDSKNPGPVLAFGRQALAVLAAQVKAGDLDL
jgi:hypothetical protein